ncbi:hypothetical protein KR018_002227 [Drosophila ironensis]|nr:hypothetical protein KR018_002227 [Drosophila ironensis]
MKVGFCVLALSPEEISSCYQVTDVRNFSDEIREAMVPMAVGKSRGFGIQRYSWPRVSQGGSLIVVGHEASGKTWCYLPRLCDLVLWHLPNRGKDDFGPTSIILCEETSQMNMISGWVNDIFRDFMPPHTTLVVIKEKKGLAKAVEAMASPVGILLTTTELFLKLIELNLHNEPFLNPQSIKSLAIDNYGEMLRLEPLNIRTMLMWARSFFTFGIAKTEIYVATRLWDEQILRYVPSPMILFEDAMEATIYYGMQYEIYLVDKNDNTPAKAVLHRVLQVNLMSNRVVVACRSHIDVICVRYELQSFGISVLAHYKEDPASLEDWEPNSVLVITDEMMPNCRLGPVDLLIHYYCATTWFRFKSRYNILYDNCVAGQTSQTSFHIIRNDDYNYAWLMADFLLKHNMDYPDSLMSVVFQQRLLSDLNDAAQQTRFELCRQVLQYGDCTRRTCRYRHFMWDNEPVPFIGDRPNEGDTIYFRILQYNNPSSIGIRIEDLEHKKASLCDELQAAFAIDKPKIKHEDPENGDIVVIYHNQLYKRALVSLNSSWNKWVHVRVLDAGVDELVLKRHQLLLCPPQFKTKPYEAMDLRITGLAPATMERIWWEDMREDILKNYFDDGMDKIFLARVDFVLGNAVFVKDLLDCRGRSLWQYITPRYVIKQNIDVKTALRKLIHQRVPFPTVTKD